MLTLNLFVPWPLRLESDGPMEPDGSNTDYPSPCHTPQHPSQQQSVHVSFDIQDILNATSVDVLIERIVDRVQSITTAHAPTEQPPDTHQNHTVQETMISKVQRSDRILFGEAVQLPGVGSFFIHTRHEPLRVLHAHFSSIQEALEHCGETLEITWLTIADTEQGNPNPDPTSSPENSSSLQRQSNVSFLLEHAQCLYSELGDDAMVVNASAVLQSLHPLPFAVPQDWRIGFLLGLKTFVNTDCVEQLRLKDLQALAVVGQIRGRLLDEVDLRQWCAQYHVFMMDDAAAVWGDVAGIFNDHVAPSSLYQGVEDDVAMVQGVLRIYGSADELKHVRRALDGLVRQKDAAAMPEEVERLSLPPLFEVLC